jgi:hypothetical protein
VAGSIGEVEAEGELWGSDESTCTELLSVFWASKGRRKEVEMRRRSFALLLLFAAEAMIA